ncbi:dTDP-4-dehydrorhamnose reductase [Gordonibacter sp. An230]|uniref:dTDP-4-dehydrorhamnose reductase n=1 Tax=Gordonibacter sp. An230 TaxID=1965592 RepID=UPI000B3892CA|nr:dTDP-4-dehydrorhamnose reductase [Gordonibacter sp. An230]OUO90507.1 dTDP-4-dehydrorhamnose reductase [Gordonibacter sp. An230]
MRVLVAGSKGQLGNELRRCFDSGEAEIGPIPLVYADAVVDYADCDVLDISDEDVVEAWFAAHCSYDLVINAAAMTNVDGCEADEAAAYRVNAHGAEHLARACAACGAKLVHVSTDYVFAGDDSRSRIESDVVRPISAYGRTKWAGEVLAQAACPRTFVVRTAWLYGYAGRNFVKTMLHLAQRDGAISVVADQYGNPTSANDLAYEILKIAATDDYGIYHCTNKGTCSWFDFAVAAVEGVGIACEKTPLTSQEYKARFPRSANRPAYSSLENRHLTLTIGDEMRPWQEALAMYLSRLSEQGG